MNRRETASPRPTWITQLSEHVQNDLEGRGIDEVEIIIPDEAVELWDVLGTEFCQLFLGLKRAENEEYQREISPWERRHLLLNV